MITSKVPDRLASIVGIPWVQMEEAYIVYTIEIRSMWCPECKPSHPIVGVIQMVHVSFTLETGTHGLMNAPPIVAGILVADGDDIRFLHIDTIAQLVRQAHAMFTDQVTPEHVLSLMQTVYHLPQLETSNAAH